MDSARTTLTRLYELNKYSDLKIICHQREFSVHKAIVCVHSPVFAAAVESFQEAFTGIVNVVDFEPDIVEAMLEWMYKGAYPSPSVSEAMSDMEKETLILSHHVRVNAIADYYNIEGLSKLTRTNIEEQMGTSTTKFLPVAVKEAFHASGDKKLHRIVSFAVALEIESLLKKESFRGLGDLNDCSLAIIRALVNDRIHVPGNDSLSQCLEHMRGHIETATNHDNRSCTDWRIQPYASLIYKATEQSKARVRSGYTVTCLDCDDETTYYDRGNKN